MGERRRPREEGLLLGRGIGPSLLAPRAELLARGGPGSCWGLSTSTWRQAEADLWSGVQARVWYIYLVVLTPGSERGCLGLNGPCVCYTNLARTATASSELRNPHLNWAFLKLFLIGNTYVAKNANINSKLHFRLRFFLQRQPVLPSFLFLVPGMVSVHVCIYTHH